LDGQTRCDIKKKRRFSKKDAAIILNAKHNSHGLLRRKKPQHLIKSVLHIPHSPDNKMQLQREHW
jgi:hypothetical protein